MTPARQCYMEGSKVKRKDTDKNDKGKTLIDYVNLQVDICNDLDIPVFDAYRYEALNRTVQLLENLACLTAFILMIKGTK